MQNDDAMSETEFFVMTMIITMIVGGILIGGLLYVESGHFDGTCINMNGHRIEPKPELCKMSCSAKAEWDHMQAHYDEVCACCKAKGINYENAGAYQPRVYVVNADGSQGEDRTCAYYPDAAGCPNVTATAVPDGTEHGCNNTVTTTRYIEPNQSYCNGGGGSHGMNSSAVTTCNNCNCTATTTSWDCSLGEHINETNETDFSTTWKVNTSPDTEFYISGGWGAGRYTNDDL